jgi:hypothetical protein
MEVQEAVPNGFEMEVNAPYTLNYLIYIQNIYLNSKNQDNDDPLFPYIDSSMWGILDEEFENIFKEVWKEAANKNFQSRMYDHNGILDFDKALYQKLFENNVMGAFGYSESVKSFLAWWNGVFGKIATESVFDNDKINEVYRELSRSLDVNKRLKIDLIYDKTILTGYTENSWYAVLPIKDIYISQKRPKIISKLLKCCEDV